MKEKYLKFLVKLLLTLNLMGSSIAAQDIVQLKDGTSVPCRITEISDFILYAEVDDDPYLATFFSDDVDYLKIDPQNVVVIRQLKKGVKDAMKYTNPIGDNSVFGFYFGMSSDSLLNNKHTEALYRTDSLGNPVLVPYNPIDTEFKLRLQSLAKSLGGSSLAWMIGL